jgi:hypothetical protein
MMRSLRCGFAVVAFAALLGVMASAANAGTIIKLSLGDDSTSFDIEFDGSTLSTVDDGGPGAGDQQTNAEFLDFVSSEPNITDLSGSFSLDGLTIDGDAIDFGFLVIQNFTGGVLKLYDGADTLLLEGTLADSVLTGAIGAPATGALFTTSFGTVTDGTLAPLILADTLTLAITFTNINGGAGLDTTGSFPGPVSLDPFDADATAIIAADPIPEPASATLLFVGMIASLVWASRRTT